MLKDSGPDNTADYFEEKGIINDSLKKCEKNKDKIKKFTPKFDELDQEI